MIKKLFKNKRTVANLQAYFFFAIAMFVAFLFSNVCDWKFIVIAAMLIEVLAELNYNRMKTTEAEEQLKFYRILERKERDGND